MKRNFLLFVVSLIYVLGNAQSYTGTINSKSNIAAVLNPDGTINTKNFSSGAFNAEGYKISYKENGEPAFLKQTGTAVAGDENWDPGFAMPGVNQGSGLTQTVYAVFVDGNDVYVGGNFATAGGIAASNVAKWNGSVWSSLGNGVGGTQESVNFIKKSGNFIYTVSTLGVSKWDGNTWSLIGTVSGQVAGQLGVSKLDIDASGNVYVIGQFTTINGVTVNCIAKWDGNSWSPLSNGINITSSTAPSVVAVQGTNVYIGGVFSSVSGVPALNIARWNGSSWSAVGGGITGTSVLVNSLAFIGTDVYAGGVNLFYTGGGTVYNVAKWDGSSWGILGSNFNSAIHSLVISGTDVYAAGGFSQTGATPVNKIAKWNGSSWTDAGNGLVMDDVYVLGISSQLFFAGGITNIYGGLNMHGVARWNGAKWVVVGNGVTNFSPGANNIVNCVAIDGNNVYIGGNFTVAGGVKVNRIAKWDGVKWDSLGGGFFFGEVFAITTMGTKVYAGGSFHVTPSAAIRFLAVWDGNSWAMVGPGIDYYVYSLAVNGTDLYVGGDFNQPGGVTCNKIAKWNGTTWSPLGSGMNGVVRSIKFASDGTLYAGGVFTTAGGPVVNHIARWNGTNWSAMALGVNGNVNDIAINAANEVYIGGSFDVAVGGGLLYRIAKFNGTAWVQVGVGVTSNGGVSSLLFSGNDLYVGGTFTTVGTVQANSIAKWDGTNWSALGSGIGSDQTTSGSVYGMAVNCRSLYAVGYFTSSGDKRADRFARYWMDGLPGVSISTANTTVCAGTNVTFNAVPVNAGTTPNYQWQVNGTNVGTNSNTYSSTTLTNNAQVKVNISGLAGCINPINVTSNTIAMTVNSQLVPTVTISGVTTVNQGNPSLISSLPLNGGSNPFYSWEDSTNTHTWQTIAGASSSAISYTPALTGNKLRCRLTSNAACASPAVVISNDLVFTVNTVTAINPVAVNNFGIKYYPNPVQEILVIDSLKLSDRWQTADVVSLDGRKLIVSQPVNNRTLVSINVARFPSGEYIVILRRTKGPSAYLKFVKE